MLDRFSNIDIPIDDKILVIIGLFFAYSMLGWLVESCYMSFCNCKVTNRGFVKGPICPIYGIGEFIVYRTLQPLANNYVALFFVGSLCATIFELFVAKIMLKKLGYVWWDYTNKPFNYKGIICLESSIGWGLYTIIEFGFLHRMMVGIVTNIPSFIIFIVACLLSVYLLTASVNTVIKVKKGEIEDKKNNILKSK